MPILKFETWDVFTTTRFAGNPLAVVLNAEGLDGEAMASVAREFNLSETVFISPPQTADCAAALRIFTPASELPFAGHPTIGAAYSVAAARSGLREFKLELAAGVFSITIDANGAAFVNPNAPRAWAIAGGREAHAAALGLPASSVLHDPGAAGAPTPFGYVAIEYDALGRIRLDFAALGELERDVEGLLVCARSPAEGVDFRVRMFAPGHGIVEDPATGSAACALPAYVLAHEGLADGHYDWRIEQGVEMGRPSLIHISFDVHGGAVGPVRVGGQAIRMQTGEMTV